MKKAKYFIVTLMAAALCGCGNTATVDGIIEKSQESSAADSEAARTPDELADSLKTIKNEEGSEYDIDLTQMSASMIYGQVYDMVYSSEDYVGKTVKMKGPFSYFLDAETGNEYFAVLISDAAACCSQGIEFVLDGSYTYPEDYPKLNEEITVTGNFNYYKEGYNTYCQLTNASIVDVE